MTKPAPSRLLEPGELAPWFVAPMLDGRDDWKFNSAAGTPCLLFLMGSAAQPGVADALATVLANRDLLDDVGARFFGVSSDPTDVSAHRIAQSVPGIRYFLDRDFEVARQFGAIDDDRRYTPHLLVLDRTLQVAGRFHCADAADAVAALRALSERPGQDWAPVLTIPNLLPPSVCMALIDLYDADGGAASGFMREIDGKTTVVTDPSFKQRRDASIEDTQLREAIVRNITRKLVPAVERTFQFKATRIERYIVAAYDAHAGHFSPHRDNTTKGTAHRRFAVSINLNADYDGGDLRFPEFGQRTYRPPVGGAIVFSCSLLHEATPVTRGRRYACLPFLYDDAAAAIRDANNAFLGEGVTRYAAS